MSAWTRIFVVFTYADFVTWLLHISFFFLKCLWNIFALGSLRQHVGFVRHVFFVELKDFLFCVLIFEDFGVALDQMYFTNVSETSFIVSWKFFGQVISNQTNFWNGWGASNIPIFFGTVLTLKPRNGLLVGADDDQYLFSFLHYWKLALNWSALYAFIHKPRLKCFVFDGRFP